MKDLSQFREEYRRGELIESEVKSNPLQQFEVWIQDAINNLVSEPNAMSVATATPEGKPSIRVVLLKELTERGFVFFTNYNSRKGKEIYENPHAAIVFDWHTMERQVRIEGIIAKISEIDSDTYFNSRPEGSKIGAWVSPQSQVVKNRQELDELQIKTEQQFEGKNIPRPPHWGGYILVPTKIEFWQGRPSRLHDRILYKLEGNKWIIERLAP